MRDPVLLRKQCPSCKVFRPEPSFHYFLGGREHRRAECYECHREVSTHDFIEPDAIKTPETLWQSIQNGMDDPRTTIYGASNIEVHVKNFLRQKFAWALLATQDPDQAALIRSLADKIGILEKRDS